MATMCSLELVPCHNKRAARNFPLTLGRVELFKWWWNSCACSKHVRITRQPCPRCKQLAKYTKLLSKKLLYISNDATLRVASQIQNAELLWYNGQPMVKSSDSTAILLQSGDSIAIGHSPIDPWMEFLVQRQALFPVTPDDDDKNANIIMKRTTPKSKRRLYYDSPSSGSLVSKSQLSFEDNNDDSPKDALYSTQQIAADASSRDGRVESSPNDEKPSISLVTRKKASPKRKRKRNMTMSPRKLLDAQGKQPAIQESETSTTSSNMNDNKRRKRPRLDDCQPTPNSQESDCSHEVNNRQSIGLEMDDFIRGRASFDSQPTNMARKESSQRSDESSFLSLPKCPTWNDEEESERRSQLATRHDPSSLPLQQGKVRQATFHSAQSQDSVESSNKQHQDDSPDIQFASALSLSQWKAFRDHGTGRVRQALSGLVVAQRARGYSTWLPTLLEGAVIDGETE